MAIKYKKISPCIWNDKKVSSMSNNGKLAFLYMLTHPLQTSIGAIRTTRIGLSVEMKGLGIEAFNEAFDMGIALDSDEAPLIWFPNFTRYNLPESPNVANSWGKSLLDLPFCNLTKIIYTSTYEFLSDMNPRFLEGFHEGLGEGKTKGFIEDYALSVTVAETVEKEKPLAKTELTKGRSTKVGSKLIPDDCPFPLSGELQ